MLLALLGIVGGLALLTLAADQFVVGAARVAISARMSKVVVGAVVIGFGTSLPEMVVSALASAQGSIDLAVGNIVGSNIANLTLVLGTAALITPITVRVDILKREALLSLAAVAVFGLVVVLGPIGLGDALLLGGVFTAAMAFIVYDARQGDELLAQEVDQFVAAGSPFGEWLRALLGLVGTLGASQLVVWSATNLADRLGWAEGFVGLTLVAVGTSLPELASSIQAARKGETDLLIGNLLGSNLFNAGAVGTAVALAGAGQEATGTVAGIGVVLMVGVAVVATFSMFTGRRVVKMEGAFLLAVFVVCIPLLAG